jgi:hypothetical protein
MGHKNQNQSQTVALMDWVLSTPRLVVDRPLLFPAHMIGIHAKKKKKVIYPPCRTKKKRQAVLSTLAGLMSELPRISF